MYCPYCGWNKNTDFEEEAGNYDFMQLEVEENFRILSKILQPQKILLKSDLILSI